MPDPKPKKTQQIILRLEPRTNRDLRAAVQASEMTIAEALRLAANAMIIAQGRFGKIPRDMEIRQAPVGDRTGARAFNQFSDDIQALLIEQVGKGFSFAQVVGAAGVATVDELANLREAYAFLLSSSAAASDTAYPERPADHELLVAEPVPKPGHTARQRGRQQRPPGAAPPVPKAG